MVDLFSVEYSDRYTREATSGAALAALGRSVPALLSPALWRQTVAKQLTR